MQFLEPKNLSQALLFRSQYPDYKILAGGTDLCVLLNSKVISPTGLLSLGGIKELKGIQEDGFSVTIGAMTTHAELIASPAIQKYVPALSQACRTIGAKQIQNQGTIGGNVMNASPAGDTLPVLLVYDTQVELMSEKGSRWVSFEKFYKGYRQTVVDASEIVTRFRITKSLQNEKSEFIKIGTRKAQAISKVMGCFRLVMENNAVSFFRAALGSVAAVPVRLKETEVYLINNTLSQAVIAKAQDIALQEVTPIDDIRSTAAYRRHVAGVLVKRFLESVV